MESKHKNALIGALLAVVFVMAVGYAAFAQQLTINGTAEISSKWDIHFDPAYVISNNAAYSTQRGTNVSGVSVGTEPSGTIEYDGTVNQQVTIDAELYQPGDKVTFILKPTNYGIGLNGTGTMTVSDGPGSGAAHGPSFPTSDPSWGGTDISTTSATTSAVTATKGYIKFTVTPEFAASLTPGNADTITVVAEYTQPEQNATDLVPTSAGITITLNYQQV